MLEIIGTLAGLISIVLTILIEWDTLRERVNRLRPAAPAQAGEFSEVVSPAPAAAPTRRSPLAVGLGVLRSLAAMLSASLVFIFTGTGLSTLAGIAPGTPAAGLVLLAALLAGLALGALVLRRSWKRIGLFLLAGALVFVIVSVLAY